MSEETATQKTLENESIPTTTRQLTVSLPEDRPNYAVGADTYALVINGADTLDKYAFIDMHVPPGGGPMPHAHEFEEMFYVVEGEVEVFCHNERITAKASSAVNIPGWSPHMFKNLSKTPARLFCVVAAAGLEREFAEIGKSVATRVTPPLPASPAEKEEMKKKMPEIAKRYNARVLPPDTFNHLLSESELELIKAADGE